MSAPAETTKPSRMKPSSVVYWFRFALALLAGFSNEALHINETTFGDLAIFVAIGVGAAFYLISVLIVRSILHYTATDLKGKSKDITLGGGTFIFLWIAVAVILFTIYG